MKRAKDHKKEGGLTEWDGINIQRKYNGEAKETGDFEAKEVFSSKMPDVVCKGLSSVGMEEVSHFLVDQELSDIVCGDEGCRIDVVSERVFDKRDNGKGYEIRVKEERAFDFVGWYTISAETCPEPEKAEGEAEDDSGKKEDGKKEDECAVDAEDDVEEDAGGEDDKNDKRELSTVCGAGTSTEV